MSKKYKPWAASDKVLLMNKVRELGFSKGTIAVADLLGRDVNSVKAMHYVISKKQEAAERQAILKKIQEAKKAETVKVRRTKITPLRGVTSLQGQELHLPIKSMEVDVKKNKIIIKL